MVIGGKNNNSLAFRHLVLCYFNFHWIISLRGIFVLTLQNLSCDLGMQIIVVLQLMVTQSTNILLVANAILWFENPGFVCVT